MIGRDRCGQVKAADWVDKKRLAKANHSSDAAIMVSISRNEKNQGMIRSSFRKMRETFFMSEVGCRMEPSHDDACRGMIK